MSALTHGTTPTSLTALRTLHDRLDDDLSRTVLRARVDFLVTGSPLPMMHLVDHGLVPVEREFSWRDFLHQVEDASFAGRLAVYGAGGEGRTLRWIVERLTSARIDVFMDRNVGLTADIPVVRPDVVADAYRAGEPWTILIGSEMYFDEMAAALRTFGIATEHILGGSAVVARQYFEPDLIQLQGPQAFVDGGALDASTWDTFFRLARSAGCATRGVAFEPDPVNVSRIEARMQEGRCAPLDIVPCGLWSSSTRLTFDATQNGSSRVTAHGNTTIDVVDLDSWTNNFVPTFIKLDIEGAELEALKGAEKTIRSARPTLAVSVYHKPSDLIDIPELISPWTVDYKYFLRQHSIYPQETILYAIPSERMPQPADDCPDLVGHSARIDDSPQMPGRRTSGTRPPRQGA